MQISVNFEAIRFKYNDRITQQAPWEAVPELEVQERPPSTEKTSMVGSLGGGIRGLGAPTINVKKYRWWAPWQVLMEI